MKIVGFDAQTEAKKAVEAFMTHALISAGKEALEHKLIEMPGVDIKNIEMKRQGDFMKLFQVSTQILLITLFLLSDVLTLAFNPCFCPIKTNITAPITKNITIIGKRTKKGRSYYCLDCSWFNHKPLSSDTDINHINVWCIEENVPFDNT